MLPQAHASLTILLGGVLGAEREFRDMAAGFRTLILISTGACIFTQYSLHIGNPQDPTHIGADVVTGIGFLGASVILRESGRITGSTTAAIIWLSAALSMGVGSGQVGPTVVAPLIILLVLRFFPVLEVSIDRMRETRSCKTTLPTAAEKVAHLDSAFEQSELKAQSDRHTKTGDHRVRMWVAGGRIKKQEALAKAAFDNPDVSGFWY